jgi:hypothetical protein
MRLQAGDVGPVVEEVTALLLSHTERDALVKSLVERMGGAVSGRNADDGGFEVRVELPQAN